MRNLVFLRSERQLPADSVGKQRVACAESCALKSARASFLSGFARLLRCRKNLSQFAEVLGGGGEEEFVICTAWAASSQSSQPENAFEVGKEHFDLFPELHRNLIFFSFGQISGNLTRVFALLAGDLARLSVGAAFLLGRADLADFFQGAIACGAIPSFRT